MHDHDENNRPGCCDGKNHEHSPPCEEEGGHSHGEKRGFLGLFGHAHAHSHAHSHGHGCHGGHSGHGNAPLALSRAIIVTFVFMLVEFVGGYFANSLALMSDASHMLTDIGAMLLSLFAFWMSRRPSTPAMSYGYHRAEILGALASGMAIWLIAGVLVYQAIARLSSPPEVHGPVVFVVAVIGLAANLISMVFLHSARKQNLNVRAAYLHVLADSLGSVAAVITGIVLWTTGWRPIDPIITLALAALMVVSSWELVKESVAILMESTPTGLDPAAVTATLRSVKGVQDVHDLHIWTLSSGRLSLSVHLISNDPEQQVLARAYSLLEDKYGITHTTIQIEHPDKFKSERCYDCGQK